MVHEENYTTLQCTSKLGQRDKGHLRNLKNTRVQNLHIYRIHVCKLASVTV